MNVIWILVFLSQGIGVCYEKPLKQREFFMTRYFKSSGVVDIRQSSEGFNSYCVGFENKKFRIHALCNLLSEVIPDFAFGSHESTLVHMTELVSRLREASQMVYTTEKYKRRGEFGELILHLLLRDFFKTVPLVSKIYFKDGPNETVKGFDSVHITKEDKRLWLGESKIYENGKDGLDDLFKDLVSHTETSYLKSEFSFISRKIPHNFPEREEYCNLLSTNTSLDKVFERMTIAFTCTYTCDLYSSHEEASDDFIKAYEKKVIAYRDHFYGKIKDKPKFDVLLLLLPVESKKQVVDEMDKKLKAMQAV